jgi:hypothetical protein
MSRQSWRVGLVLLVVLIALMAIAQHFGWLAAPPLLAPGIH